MILNSFYSGFSLKEEELLFEEYRTVNNFTISGFSYGAQQAFEAVLNSTTRVDVLQLFSPAFFQNKDKKYKRMQLMFFKKDAKSYCENFLKNICYPSSLNMQKYFKEGSYEQLESLLTYEWSETKLQALVDKGVKIEVYLGAEDKIIDANKAKEFFKQFATVYYIKDCGHILNNKI